MRYQAERTLLKGNKCLILQPELIKVLGKSTSLFLQQLHYWISSEKGVGKVINGQKWVYNTAQAWADQIVASEPTVRRSISKLKSLNVISTSHHHTNKSDRTNWYTINYDILNSLIGKDIANNHDVKMIAPSDQNDRMVIRTEITSETSNKTNLSEPQVEKIVPKINSEQVTQGLDRRNNLSQDLLDIWNEEVGKITIPAQMTKIRARFLIAAFKSKFASSTEEWRAFCKKISSSDFLIGKVKSTFKATLDWVLKFEIIQRILEGDFGCNKPEDPTRLTQEDKTLIEAEIINRIDEGHEIKNLRKQLLERVGASSYKAWFKNVEIVANTNEITIKAHSRFMVDNISTRYGLELEQLTQKPIRYMAA
jgi:hypothetical protein